ncbi:MAG: CAAX prenyl protease-related protein [Candidatus Pacearchaeota archaeon]
MKSRIFTYIFPFALYLLIPFILDSIGLKEFSYFIKILLVGITLIYFFKSYDLKFAKGNLFLSFVLGLLIFVLWILVEQFMPYKGEFEISAFNIIVRLFGSILVAPLIEELFTRKFLLRFLINPDKWDKIEPKFTWFSFMITVLFFGFSHNRWLAGIIVGIILNMLYIKTKRIENCIIAHSVANASLAGYIILTNSWQFW